MSNAKRPAAPPPPAGTPTATKVIIAVIALLCVAAVVWLGVAVSGDDDEGGSTDTSASAAEVGTPDDCAEVPEPPASPPTFDTPPDPELAEGAVWEATITTNCGEITAELYGDEAPQTVASFISLAEEDYWVDSPCHRLVTTGIFVLQCGDPTGTGSGNPGYGYGVENAPADGQYPRGTLAMARTQDPNSNGGQWFIVYDETSIPDPTGYTIFGQVTGGMEIVDAIAEAGTGEDQVAPAQPISILDVSVEKQA